MGGCYGSSAEDVHFNNQLEDYLDGLEDDIRCPVCGSTDIECIDYAGDSYLCDECGTVF